MKHFTGILVGLILSLVLIASSSASPVSFEDMIDDWTVWGFGSGVAWITECSPLTYTHDISDDIDLTSYLVTEAWLELDFTNDFTDDYGSKSISCFGIHWTKTWDYRENVSYAFNGNDWIEIGEVDNGQHELVVNVDWLNDNGELDVALSVSNPLGGATAWLDHSRLYGNAAPIPEPATLFLLGTGLIGLAGISRKK